MLWTTPYPNPPCQVTPCLQTVPWRLNAQVPGSGLRHDVSTLNRVADVARGSHSPQVAVGPHRAAEHLKFWAPVGRVHTRLAVAPFGEWHWVPALQNGTDSGVTCVAVGRAAAGCATGRVADAAQSAGTAREQGRVTDQGGKEGEGEGTLTLEDTLWRAEAWRSSSSWTVAAVSNIWHRRLPILLLDSLDLMPLQLQQPLQVPFQRAYRPGPWSPSALHIVEDSQLTEVPRVKRWRKEVREVIVVTALCSGSVSLSSVVFSIDVLWPQLELRRNPNRRRERKSLWLWQVRVTVTFSVAAPGPDLQLQWVTIQEIRTWIGQAMAGESWCASARSETCVLLFSVTTALSSRLQLWLHSVFCRGLWRSLSTREKVDCIILTLRGQKKFVNLQKLQSHLCWQVVCLVDDVLGLCFLLCCSFCDYRDMVTPAHILNLSLTHSTLYIILSWFNLETCSKFPC